MGGPSYPERIEEANRELTEVTEDFDRAMDYETLRIASIANEASKLSFYQSVNS